MALGLIWGLNVPLYPHRCPSLPRLPRAYLGSDRWPHSKACTLNYLDGYLSASYQEEPQALLTLPGRAVQKRDGAGLAGSRMQPQQ